MIYAGEALLRWQPPGQDSRTFNQIEAAVAAVSTARDDSFRKKGSAPSPAANNTEMELDAWALSVICRTAATWPYLRGHAPVVSINISAGQIPGGGLPKLIHAALAMSRLDPRSLELSIDAAVLLLPEADIAPTLRALADMRVRLALDNFDRNPASVAQLSRYRFGVLKLDANLTAQIGRNDWETALIDAIIQMCAPLGIRVMARGVSRQAQQDFLLALGCNLQQGSFIGTAQEEHVFAGFLSERLFC